MLKFLQRAPKSASALPIDSGVSGGDSGTSAAPIVVPAGNISPAKPSAEPFAGKTSADFESGQFMIGAEDARKALEELDRAKPRSLFFIAAPRTLRHAHSIRTLLAGKIPVLPASDAAVLAVDFADDDQLRVLRLARSDAQRLSRGVADAIEMLSITLPSAFDSDSARVARLALDEELRSGHDTSIDTLKRKALAQNIGLLRTPLGYAVAPMHEGRVVAADVFKALPDRLKADVEAKLEAFETELSGVLANRSQLQQDYCSRLRELDREVAGLAVRASLAELAATFAGHADAAAWLDALGTDLTRNASLFVSAARRAQGHSRAPIEIANDPTLSRYRVNVLGCVPSLINPSGLDRCDLSGVVTASSDGGTLAPSNIRPGALIKAGGGFVVIDARDLLAHSGAWPMLRNALNSGFVTLADAANPATSTNGISLPFDARLIIAGDLNDYNAWCALDRDVAAQVRLIDAVPATIAVTPDTERAFASLVAAIVREDGLPPVDGAAMALLLKNHMDTSLLRTDLETLGDDIARAAALAKSDNRNIVTAPDVLAAQKSRIKTASEPS